MKILAPAFFMILWLGGVMNGYCQPPNLKFKYINLEQGLSNSSIECIFQDSEGFIWFGTRDGLNRFDGSRMTVYKNSPGNQNTISDNYITTIFEDSDKQLWVGTTNGLNQFDKVHGRFIRHMHNGEAGRISSNAINDVTGDSKGNIWVATRNGGLNKFSRSSKSFTSYKQKGAKEAGVNNINALLIDKTKGLWIATDRGLFYFDFSSGRFVRPAKASVLDQNKFLKIIQDKKSNLWLATEDRGLFCFSTQTKQVKSYVYHALNPTSLGSDMTRAVLEDHTGKIWVGCVNGGLNLLNSSGESFFRYVDQSDKPGSLSQRTVSALFEDRQGNLWVGTHRGGINLYSPYAKKFELYTVRSTAGGLSYNDVRTFYEGENGNIWIGTDGGGLILYDTLKKKYTTYRYNPFNANTIGADAILSILEDKRGNLWIGTWAGGLNLYDSQTGTFKRYLNKAGDKYSISSNNVNKVFQDRQGRIWVGTYYGGVNLFNPLTGKFTRFIKSPVNGTHITGNNVLSINEDNEKNIWIGTDDGGLNAYNTRTGIIKHYFDASEKKPGITVIFKDSKGRIWAGLAGLYMYDRDKDVFRLYTSKAGLGTEFIKSIEEDEHGNLWISTSNGLTKLNTATLDCKKYNTVDGLQGSEFEFTSSMHARNGKMFFGGTRGFNVFDPDSIKSNPYVPPVYLTQFDILNKKVLPGIKNSPLKKDINYTSEIRLNHRQSSVAFSFAALNYISPENNQYSYKLENFDKSWSPVSKETKASYTNLDPGTYVFSVKASNNDGLWNNSGASVKIIIAPPFWAAWWFRLIVLSAISAAIYFYLRERRRKEIQKIEDLKKEEMVQVQFQFFTNISHEFRTPLSLILGPLEKLKNEQDPRVFKQHFNIIHRNANRLVMLINELMDFRKVSSGALKIKVAQGDLTEFLRDIAGEFKVNTGNRKLHLQLDNDAAFSNVWFDRQVLEKIILNLMNNSFKYTAEDGEINLGIFRSLNDFKPSFKNQLIIRNDFRADDYIYIRIGDNGIGISSESMPHLFERYYRVSSAHLGSGVGLAFVKSLTLLHKGDIYVHSEYQKGTEVIIALPFGGNNFTSDEKLSVDDASPGMLLESIHYDRTNQLDGAGRSPAALLQNKHDFAKALILLVDDNDELREFIKGVLIEKYNVIEAVNGREGLDKARERSPDLIIADIMMPVMNGIELCDIIKNDIDTSHIPFIMLTARSSIESNIEGVGSGADFYFSKPVSIEVLMLTIRNVLNQKKKLKERYLNDYYSDAKELVHSAKDKEFMDTLLEVIESQLLNPDMDIDLICKQVFMSRSKLYAKITSITGQSPLEFIRSYRLKKALQIMSAEDVSLNEVMYRVGIQTPSHFTKAFKKEFGKTPTQFLESLKKK